MQEKNEIIQKALGRGEPKTHAEYVKKTEKKISKLMFDLFVNRNDAYAEEKGHNNFTVNNRDVKLTEVEK